MTKQEDKTQTLIVLEYHLVNTFYGRLTNQVQPSLVEAFAGGSAFIAHKLMPASVSGHRTRQLIRLLLIELIKVPFIPGPSNRVGIGNELLGSLNIIFTVTPKGQRKEVWNVLNDMHSLKIMSITDSFPASQQVLLLI